MHVVITKGLPASGKTTYAKSLQGYKRINKDDLRAMLDNSVWSRENEAFILDIRDAILQRALAQKKNVVIDDTNLTPKHIERITQVVNGQADIHVQDFTDVPLEECIARDQKRAHYVGEKVIRKMHSQFVEKREVSQLKQDASLPSAIICDLDGTLALFGDNNPYERDFASDTVNEPIKQILKDYQWQAEIIIVSGRKDKFEDETREWLQKNGIPFTQLYMRPTNGKHEPKDVVIKEDIYNYHIQGKVNVLFVLDDRDGVVAMWRQKGLTCLQVNYGDF